VWTDCLSAAFNLGISGGSFIGGQLVKGPGC
jgi:predicted MFS family arabinose efflux permease